jgi:hypothetical protein
VLRLADDAMVVIVADGAGGVASSTGFAGGGHAADLAVEMAEHEIANKVPDTWSQIHS